MGAQTILASLLGFPSPCGVMRFEPLVAKNALSAAIIVSVPLRGNEI